MSFRSANTALAVAVQADNETRATISTSTDVFPIANLRPSNQVFTQANPEYIGSIHKPGDFVLGRESNIAFDVIARGPGGSAVPAANAYQPGRILRTAGFVEIVLAAAITGTLASASNAGDTTTVTLAAGASAVDDFYVGYVIQFSDIASGTGFASTSQIIAYNGTTKVATLGEKLATAPAADYTIPPQLIYRLASAAPEVYLTYDYWLDKKRYKQQHGVANQFQFTVPTSSRGNTALPTMAVGLQGEIDENDDEADETSPAVTPGGSAPPFRNGKLILNGIAVGGASAAYQHGIQTDAPPNPNKPGGADATVVVETRRSVDLNLNENLLTVQDRNALANLQTDVPLMLAYGNVAGKTVYMCVPAGRLNFSAPDPSGNFVTNQTSLFIDGAEKAVAISYPYYS